MTKGADSVIQKLLTVESLNSEMFQVTKQHVDEFATQGLRTLYLAEKYLNEEYY